MSHNRIFGDGQKLTESFSYLSVPTRIDKNIHRSVTVCDVDCKTGVAAPLSITDCFEISELFNEKWKPDKNEETNNQTDCSCCFHLNKKQMISLISPGILAANIKFMSSSNEKDFDVKIRNEDERQHSMNDKDSVVNSSRNKEKIFSIAWCFETECQRKD